MSVFGDVMFTIQRYIGIATVAFFAAALPGANLHAQDLGNGWGPNAIEITKLPDYCQRFFREKTLPPNCDGVHHLCAGKVLINRSMDYAIPKTERQRILRMATGEVNYIFGRKNPSCLMMDEARATQKLVQTLTNLSR